MGTGVFEYSAAVFKIRFIKGNTGFDNPTWLGYPCAGLVGTTEVEVRQPVGTILVDGSSLSNFGQLAVGMTGKTKYYTIRNVGTADLTNLKVSINGANKANFILVAPSKTSIPPNTSVTFEVSFKPNFAVTRTSTLRIVSNDEDENPFDITLTGMGVAP